MKRLKFMCAVLTAILAANGLALANDWENEEIIGINKEPFRVFSVPMLGREEALARHWSESENYLSLNGRWKFNMVNHPDKRPVDFYKPDFPVDDWDEIRVPAHWQTQGFGVPIYVNQAYIFKRDWPNVMGEPPSHYTTYEHRNEVGSYRREFSIPEDWDEREVFIHFMGVESAFYIWVNGERVGYSQGSYTSAEFNITPYLQAGENTLAVEVYRLSDGSYLECQDFWRLSGIFRDVFLYSTPQTWLRDYHFKSELDADYRDATFEVETQFFNLGENPESVHAELELLDPDGKVVWKDAGGIESAELGGDTTKVFRGSLENPLKWTGETPNLYTLLIHNNGPDGENLETHRHRVGFREIEFSEEGEMLINGNPIIIKGVNRHELNPDYGRHVPDEQMWREARLMKQLNINTVRHAHYPNHPLWYEICDELGIYMLDEANIESHGYYYGDQSLSHPPEWEKAHVARNISMVERSKNHAGIVFWSLGNEAGPGKNFHAASAAIREIDPSRPIQYERFPSNNYPHDDVDSHMYPSVGWLHSVGAHSSSRPVFICEYSHAMGNSVGNLDEYVEAFEDHKRLIGGCIWDWTNQGLRKDAEPGKVDPLGRDYFFAFGGDFGDRPNDNAFCMNGILHSEHQPVSRTWQVKRSCQPADFMLKDNVLIISNKLYHTKLSDLHELYIELERNGVAVARRRIDIPEIGPGQTGSIDLDEIDELHVEPIPGDELMVKASIELKENTDWAEAGHLVAWEQFDWSSAPADMIDMSTMSGGLTASKSDAGLYLEGSNFSARFDPASGNLASLVYDGREMIAQEEGPLPYYWRAPTDNDGFARGSWSHAGLDALEHRAKSIEVTDQGPRHLQVTVNSESLGSGAFKSEQTIVYTFLADGSLLLDASLSTGEPGQMVLARSGLRMKVDGAYDQVTWLGRGPFETYQDRKTGAQIGRYELPVAQMYEPYEHVQGMGNREDARWLALTDAEGRGIFIDSQLDPIAFTTLHLTDHQLAAARHPTDLVPRDHVMLNLDIAQTGVGGGACGPSTLDKYRVYTGTHHLRLLVRPIRGADPQELVATVPIAATPQVIRDAKGFLRVESRGDKAAQFEITMNGQDPMIYTAPIPFLEGGEVRVWAIPSDDEIVGMTVVRNFDYLVDRSGWSVSASSEESGVGDIQNILDGKPNTHWHSRWRNNAPQPPHHIDIDMGEEKAIAGIKLLPRQDNDNGLFKTIRVYRSDDEKDWTAIGDEYSIANNRNEKEVAFPAPVSTRYIRVEILDSHRGPWATLAEFSIIADQ